MMREIVLFDFDYTLLDCAKFKNNFKTRISEFIGVNLEEFLFVEGGYVKREQGFTDFIPEEYIKYISDSFQKDYSDILKVFYDDNNFEDVLFPDVIETLNNISKDYEIGIFSECFKEYQLLKLKKTDVLKYFNQDLIYIFDRKLTEEVLNFLPSNCFIVDDNPSVISALVELNRFKPIWLNRKTKDKHEKCVTIFGLVGIETVLKNYSNK